MPAESAVTLRSPRRRFLPLQRARQVSESHCGPAVVQILLGRLGIDADQERLTDLAGAVETIGAQGTRIDQLALAVKRLNAGARLWYKCEAAPEELVTMVAHYGYPAGVEWQGLFEDREEDENEDGDYGHYSIVTRIDRARGQVTILDPYKDFYERDRIFPFDWFVRRWWDTNLVTDPQTGQAQTILDRRCLFVVTPARARFPARLGMQTL